MPEPRPKESKKSYMKRCQKHVIEKEKEDPKRAYKKCEGMWNQHNKKKSEANQMLNDVLSQQFWFMESNTLEALLSTVQKTDISEAMEANQDAFGIFTAAEKKKGDEKPYKIDNGIAIIPIQGHLMKKASGFFAMLFGIRSMQQIGKEIEMAIKDSDVSGIFLDIDSTGGSVDGTVQLADIVSDSSDKKPTLTFADGAMTSAAYWIGSSANYIVVADQTTRIGSIGVVGVHMEKSEMAKKIGVGIHVFGASKFKNSGNPFEKLSKDDVKYIQNQFDYLYDLFIDGVSKNLGISKNKIPKNVRESMIFIGEKGLKAGLADEILTRSEAMSKLRSVIDGNDTFDNRSIQAKNKGGEQKMDLEARIKELEKELAAKVEEIQAFSSDQVTKELNDKIEALEAECSDFKASIETLEAEVTALKESKDALSALAKIGEAALGELKDEIKKLSVQAKGTSHDEKLLDKQLEAFGNDYDVLISMKTDLEGIRDKLFKTGNLDPDDKKTEVTKKAEEYDLGKKLGKANLSIVANKK